MNTIQLKKIWQKPELVIIAENNINGGGLQTNLYEGAPGSLIHNTINHNVTPSFGSGINYVS